MNKLFKQSITRANANILEVLATRTAIEVFLVLVFIVEIVGLGALCAYVDGTFGLGSPLTLLFVFFPGVILIVGQVWYITALFAAYQELKKEQE